MYERKTPEPPTCPNNTGVVCYGNAVPLSYATALARANWPEACGKEMRTMAELNDAWAI